MEMQAQVDSVLRRINRSNPLPRTMKEDHNTQYPDTEKLSSIIQELRERSLSHPIIVEGLKDRESLSDLGVQGYIILLNQGKPLIDLCTDISRTFREVTILTDWDAKGNTLCMNLKRNLKACDVSFDTRLRGRLAALLRKDVKDVQGIAPFLRKNHPKVLAYVRERKIS